MRRGALLLIVLGLSASGAHSGEAEVKLLTDSAIPRYLARGRELARAQQWDKVVDVLHRVVIGDPEVFPDLKPENLHSAVYSEDGLTFYPAREFCLRELCRMPPEGLEAYRAAFDGEARTLFERAEKQTAPESRLGGYAKVYESFLVSSVGDDALERAADLHLAYGRFYEALGLLRRLAELYPRDNDRDMALVLAKAAHCAARIGDGPLRHRLLESLVSTQAGASVVLEGRQVPVEELATHPYMQVRAARRASGRDWPLPGGSPDRARCAEDLPEELARRPYWRHRLRERDARPFARFGFWIVTPHDRGPLEAPSVLENHFNAVRPYPTVRPIVQDGVVYYKDYRELLGRRCGSGRLTDLMGRYPVDRLDRGGGLVDPAHLYPARLVRPGVELGDKEAERYEIVYRWFDYGGSTVVSGAGTLFSVEALERAEHLTRVEPMESALPANLLAAYDAGDGKTLWAWSADYASRAVRDEPALREAWESDFQAHPDPHFLGPGVAAHGTLYTLAQENLGESGRTVLWAFDLRTGMVRFRTPLHERDEFRKRLPAGAALAVAGDLVYALPGTGIVAAVDALPPGRVRWIRRYDRNFDRSPGGRGPTPMGQVQQTFAYNEPLVVAGKVIVAPPDADHVIALDAESGQPVWKRPLSAIGTAYHIVGAGEGVLALAGENVVGLDLSTGETRWGPKPHGGSVAFGRGFCGRTYVHLPATLAPEPRSIVARFELATGREAEPLVFEVERLGNLLHVDGRLIAANDEEVLLFSTSEREIDWVEQRIAEGGEGAAWLLERARIRLRTEPPDRERAGSDLETARVRAASDPALADLELEICEEELFNLLGLAREGGTGAPLEKAREVVARLRELVSRSHAWIEPPHPYEAQVALIEVELLARSGRGAASLEALERFLDLYERVRVLGSDGTVQEAPQAADLLREALLAGNQEFRAAFEARVRERIRAAYEAGDKAQLESIPERYGRRPPSEESLFELARLCEGKGESAEAELALRRFVQEFPGHSRRVEAHLRLALLLARRGMPDEARVERDAGLQRLDEEGRARFAELLAELDQHLPAAEAPLERPRIRIPLSGTPLPLRGAPVRIEGRLPETARDLLVLAGEGSYEAFDAEGKRVWSVERPAAEAASPGAAGDPVTATAAALIAGARFAAAREGDLVLGDAGGLLCVDAATGEIRWRYPREAETADREARVAVAALRRDLEALRNGERMVRREMLPRYALAGHLVIRVHPHVGIEAFDARSGQLRWQNIDHTGALAGPPQVAGQLLAVAQAQPGRVRIFDLGAGDTPIAEYLVERKGEQPGALLGPPLLDPLGRLVLAETGDPDAGLGRVRILHARTLAPASEFEVETLGLNAMVLAADGAQVVVHDGSSRGPDQRNLHILELSSGRRSARHAGDLLRQVHTIHEGSRLFVFSHTPGLEKEGARLLRIDLGSGEALRYAYPVQVPAYAVPVLTARYVVVAGSDDEATHVRFYDREASPDNTGPQPVFAGQDGKETSSFDLRSTGDSSFAAPTALSALGRGVAAAGPFAAVLLQGDDAGTAKDG